MIREAKKDVTELLPGRKIWFLSKTKTRRNTNGKTHWCSSNRVSISMKGRCAGLGKGFDLGSKFKGIWKKSICKGVCELRIAREILWQVLGSLLTLLFVLTGRNASSKVLCVRLI